MKHPIQVFLLLFGSFSLQAQERPELYVPATDPAVVGKLAAWQDAKLGLMVTWGIYSQWGIVESWSLCGEDEPWCRRTGPYADDYDAYKRAYRDLKKTFAPVRFDPRRWAAAAAQAGMKYLVFTTKHHDGFCMFDTKQTDYNIMHSPFGRDAVKELAAACRKEGLAFGTYYSTCDWRHPDFPLGSPGGHTTNSNPNMDRYTAYLRAQVTELIQNYGPLIEMWFDVPQETGPDRGIPTANLVRSLQPDILINSRVYRATNQTGPAGRQDNVGDFSTPEQKVGAFNLDRPWETCMTLCRQWAWKPDDTMKSLQQCLQTLILTAGGDGNLLFNVGPMPDGRIEPRQVERLKEMGAWLSKYGNSIYGTRGGPFKPGQWGASTRKGNRIYLHAFKWSGDTLELPALPAKITAATFPNGGAVEFRQTTTNLSLHVPPVQQDPIDTLIALDLNKPAIELAPIEVGRLKP